MPAEGRPEPTPTPPCSPPPLMKGFWQAYQTQLRVRPKLTNVLSSGVIAFTGDCAAQAISCRRRPATAPATATALSSTSAPSTLSPGPQRAAPTTSSACLQNAATVAGATTAQHSTPAAAAAAAGATCSFDGVRSAVLCSWAMLFDAPINMSLLFFVPRVLARTPLASLAGVPAATATAGSGAISAATLLRAPSLRLSALACVGEGGSAMPTLDRRGSVLALGVAALPAAYAKRHH